MRSVFEMERMMLRQDLTKPWKINVCGGRGSQISFASTTFPKSFLHPNTELIHIVADLKKSYEMRLQPAGGTNGVEIVFHVDVNLQNKHFVCRARKAVFCLST